MGRARLELVGQSLELELLDRRCTIGRTGADLSLGDRAVSRLHAVVDPVGAGWVIADLGSRNGTFVNGVRVQGLRALRHGDEVRVGASRLRFSTTGQGSGETSPLEGPPRLTRRQRDLLAALCRPLLVDGYFAPPASVATMAAELVVSESAVKKLLARTYDDFDLLGRQRHRGELAAEALRRGAVTAADVLAPPPTPG